jgi:hypothetical protein
LFAEVVPVTFLRINGNWTELYMRCSACSTNVAIWLADVKDPAVVGNSFSA